MPIYKLPKLFKLKIILEKTRNRSEYNLQMFNKFSSFCQKTYSTKIVKTFNIININF